MLIISLYKMVMELKVRGYAQGCIQIYSIWIYLNKCYLFVIHAWVEGVFVCYLFKVDLNTIWIHSRQTRGDGRGKNGSNKTTELHISTFKMGIYRHHSIDPDRSKSIGRGGVDFGVRHRVGTHLGGQLEIWIHLNVFKKYLFSLQRVFKFFLFALLVNSI